MQTDLTAVIGANTDPAMEAIRRLVAKPYKLNLSVGQDMSGALGRIRSQLGEFDKSLAASNARVLAFSASAGAMFAVTKSLREMVRVTVEVERKMTSINSILGAGRTQFKQFGNDLFKIARDTSTSFEEVADAAEELARQGVGIEETLKRTSSAMKLAKVSGVEVRTAVDAITAALNSNNDAWLDSEKLINKLVAVDAKFAVSAGGLAEAIKRVGSVASDAGLDIDELVAAITSAQQTTARGEAVIGNALKTIFTRAQRPKVLEDFESLGIVTKKATGENKSLSDVLIDVAKRYDDLSSAQQQSVSEMVGGVYQINILKALFRDLGKETSFFGSALNTSRNATNEADRRIAELNETLDSLFKKLTANLTQVGSGAGNDVFGPLFKNLLKGANAGLEQVNREMTGESGQIFGKSFEVILKGIGNTLNSPILIGGFITIARFMVQTAREGREAIKTLAGLNNSFHSLEIVTADAGNWLRQNPKYLQDIVIASKSAEGATRALAAATAAYNKEKAQQVALDATIGSNASAIARAATVISVPGRGGTEKLQVKKAAVGLIPQIQETVGAYAGGYKPGRVKDMNVPGMGRVYYNTAEKVKWFPGMGQPAIMPPQSSRAGRNYEKDFSERHGFNPYAAGGLIPNFNNYRRIKLWRGEESGNPHIERERDYTWFSESKSHGDLYDKNQQAKRFFLYTKKPLDYRNKREFEQVALDFGVEIASRQSSSYKGAAKYHSDIVLNGSLPHYGSIAGGKSKTLEHDFFDFAKKRGYDAVHRFDSLDNGPAWASLKKNYVQAHPGLIPNFAPNPALQKAFTERFYRAKRGLVEGESLQQGAKLHLAKARGPIERKELFLGQSEFEKYQKDSKYPAKFGLDYNVSKIQEGVKSFKGLSHLPETPTTVSGSINAITSRAPDEVTKRQLLRLAREFDYGVSSSPFKDEKHFSAFALGEKRMIRYLEDKAKHSEKYGLVDDAAKDRVLIKDYQRTRKSNVRDYLKYRRQRGDLKSLPTSDYLFRGVSLDEITNLRRLGQVTSLGHSNADDKLGTFITSSFGKAAGFGAATLKESGQGYVLALDKKRVMGRPTAESMFGSEEKNTIKAGRIEKDDVLGVVDLKTRQLRRLEEFAAKNQEVEKGRKIKLSEIRSQVDKRDYSRSWISESAIKEKLINEASLKIKQLDEALTSGQWNGRPLDAYRIPAFQDAKHNAEYTIENAGANAYQTAKRNKRLNRENLQDIVASKQQRVPDFSRLKSILSRPDSDILSTGRHSMSGGLIPNFSKDIFHSSPAGNALISLYGKTAEILGMATNAEGTGGSKKIYQEIFEKVKSKGIKTVTGKLQRQDRYPKDDSDVSAVKAMIPQVTRARFGKYSILGVGNTEVRLNAKTFDKDLAKNAALIRAQMDEGDLPFLSTYLNKGLVPNFAKFNLPKVKNSEIQKRLTDAFGKGSDYKDFYSIVGGAFSNKSDAVNFGGIASALSPRVPDYVAGPASIAAFRHFQKTGSQNVDDYLDLPITGSVGNYKTIGQLGFFGPNGARRAGLKKAITGQTLARRDTDKTRHYAEALAGNEDSFPIDTNVLRAVFGKTVEGTLKVGSAKRLIKIAKQTASELNISPRQLQAGIFKGVNSRHSNKYTSEYTQGLRQSLMSNGGLIPNFSALSDSISREAAAVNPGIIRVGSHSELRGPGNPDGVGVYNLRDEPLGLSQGVERAKSVGLNPKTHGIPNYADGPIRKGATKLKNDFFGDASAQDPGNKFYGAMALSMAAPLAPTILGEGKTTKATEEALNALSLGFTLSTFLRGPKGKATAIGIAGVSGFYNVIKQATNNFTALKTDTELLKDNLQKASNGLNVYVTTLESLQNAYLNNNISAEKIGILQNKLADSLAKLPTELRQQLIGAKSGGQVQNIVGKYSETQEAKLQEKEFALGLNTLLNEQFAIPFSKRSLISPLESGTKTGEDKLNAFADILLNAISKTGMEKVGGSAGLGRGDLVSALRTGGLSESTLGEVSRVKQEQLDKLQARMVERQSGRESDIKKFQALAPQRQREIEQAQMLEKRMKGARDTIKQTFEQIGQMANLRISIAGRRGLMGATGIGEQIQSTAGLIGETGSPAQAAMANYKAQIAQNQIQAASGISNVFGGLRGGISSLYSNTDLSRMGEIPARMRAGQGSLMNILGGSSVSGIGEGAISLFKSLGKDDDTAEIKKLMADSNEKLVEIYQTLEEQNKLAEIQKNVALQRAEFERTLKVGGGLGSFMDRGVKAQQLGDIYSGKFGLQTGIFSGQGSIDLMRAFLGAGGKSGGAGFNRLMGVATESRAQDIISSQKDLNRAFSGTGLALDVPNLSDARKIAETQIAAELKTGDSAMEKQMAQLQAALSNTLSSTMGGQLNSAAQIFGNVLAGSSVFANLNSTIDSTQKTLQNLDATLKSLQGGGGYGVRAGGNIPISAAATEKMMAKAGGYNPGYIRRAGNLIYNSAERVDYLPGVREPVISPPPGSLAGFLHRQNFKGLGFAAEGKDLSDYLARVNSSNFPENIRAHLIDQGARMRPEQLNKIHDIYYKKHFGTDAPQFTPSSQAAYTRFSWQTNGNTGPSNSHAEKVAETLRRKAAEADFNANSYGRRGVFETSTGFKIKSEEAMRRQAASADFNANSGGRRGVFNMPNSSLPGSAEAQQRIIESQIKIQERAMGISGKFTEAKIKNLYNLRPAAYSNVVTSQGGNFIGPRVPVAQSNIANNFYGPTQYDRVAKMARQVGVGGGLGLGLGAYEAVKGLSTIKGGSEAARAGDVKGVAMETAGQALSYLGAAAAVPTSLAPTLAPVAGAIASGAGAGALLLGGAAAVGGIGVTAYQAIKAQNQATQAYRDAGLSPEQVAKMKESGQLEKSHLLEGYDKGKAGSFSRMTSGVRRQTIAAKNFIQTGFNGTADYISEVLTGANNPEEYSFAGSRRDWSRQMRERQEAQMAQASRESASKAYKATSGTRFQQQSANYISQLSPEDRVGYYRGMLQDIESPTRKFGHWGGKEDYEAGMKRAQAETVMAGYEKRGYILSDKQREGITNNVLNKDMFSQYEEGLSVTPVLSQEQRGLQEKMAEGRKDPVKYNAEIISKMFGISDPKQMQRLQIGVQGAMDKGNLQGYVKSLGKPVAAAPAGTAEKPKDENTNKPAVAQSKLDINVNLGGNVETKGSQEDKDAMQAFLNTMFEQIRKEITAIAQASGNATVRSALSQARGNSEVDAGQYE